MRQENSGRQSRGRSRTRNQRKRDLMRVICTVFALFVIWAMVMAGLVKAFVEEPLVDGTEYIESIGGDPDVFFTE